MRILSLLSVVMLLHGGFVLAQTTYGIGSTPSEAQLNAWDIDISPTGEGLPSGRGNAKEGVEIFANKCIACHGNEAVGGLAPRLLKADVGPNADPWEFGKILPIRSPYATTIWDFINRGMPLGQEGTLSSNEVYALTAYLLNINGIIQEDDIMDAQSLPKIIMPNRENWAPLPDYKIGMDRLEGYPY
ncbi:MAG: c-type cytochrome [Gammaproteobacteria bacterium]|jgi:mono/diheme cytochrome c family protein